MTSILSPLATLEPRLRTLLPADLYALAWVDPSPATLTKVFEHLRTLRRILYDYMPRILSDGETGSDRGYTWVRMWIGKHTGNYSGANKRTRGRRGPEVLGAVFLSPQRPRGRGTVGSNSLSRKEHMNVKAEF